MSGRAWRLGSGKRQIPWRTPAYACSATNQITPCSRPAASQPTLQPSANPPTHHSQGGGPLTHALTTEPCASAARTQPTPTPQPLDHLVPHKKEGFRRSSQKLRAAARPPTHPPPSLTGRRGSGACGHTAACPAPPSAPPNRRSRPRSGSQGRWRGSASPWCPSSPSCRGWCSRAGG